MLDGKIQDWTEISRIGQTNLGLNRKIQDWTEQSRIRQTLGSRLSVLGSRNLGEFCEILKILVDSGGILGILKGEEGERELLRFWGL